MTSPKRISSFLHGLDGSGGSPLSPADTRSSLSPHHHHTPPSTDKENDFEGSDNETILVEPAWDRSFFPSFTIGNQTPPLPVSVWFFSCLPFQPQLLLQWVEEYELQ